MQKLPKPVLIFIFLLICGLLFFIVCLVRTLYGAKIEFNETQYYITFGIIAVISFCAGIAFMLPQKAFTVENFILRMNNIITINTTIINLYRKKLEIIEKDPALKEIPDSVKVVISTHEIKGEKKK